MDKDIERNINILKKFINNESRFGLRNIHREETFPRIVAQLEDYNKLKRNVISKEIREYDMYKNKIGWSCPTCGQWCYKDYNYHYCGRCGQKFEHIEKDDD